MSARSVIQSLRTPLGSLRLLLLLAIALLAAALFVANPKYHDFLCGMALGVLVPAGFATFSIREITLKEDHRDSDLQPLKLS